MGTGEPVVTGILNAGAFVSPTDFFRGYDELSDIAGEVVIRDCPGTEAPDDTEVEPFD